MDFSRIMSSVDVETLTMSQVVMIGGAYRLCIDLVRCGVRSFVLVDFDTISASNIARQDFNTTDIARSKVETTAEEMLKINPDIEVETYKLNYCAMSREEHDSLFSQANLFIFSADFFLVDARGNLEANRLGIPALFIGLYTGGRAGEVIYWHPDVTPACYRCIASSRYQAFSQGQGNVSISSDGGTIFDLRSVDSVAGHIALGLLTRGADNRYGRLIDQLGNRNLLQIKNDPEYTMNGKDIFGKYLGSDEANFFPTIALAMERDPNCPDCSSMHSNTNRSGQNVS